MTSIEILRKVPLLSFLSDDQLREISPHVVMRRFEKDEFVFREGDRAEWLYFLQSGVVRCLKYGENGKEFILKALLPGDVFCCESVTFDGSSVHPGNAQAMGPVSILKVSRQAYLRQIARHPQAGMQLISYLGGRLRESQDTAKSLALDPAEKRLAALLVRLADKIGEPVEQGIRIAVAFTREDLGHMVGLAEETVVRILSRWRTQGLVSSNGAKTLVVQDLATLKTLAC